MTTLASAAAGALPGSTAAAGAPRDSFWLRIAADLTDAISRGAYLPGERLPSEHALAERFGANRHTIRRSLAQLCRQGLLRVSQGSGTYVEDFAVDVVLARRTRHQQNLALAGLRGGLQVLQARTVRANAAQARALGVAARSSLLRLDVLGDAQGRPLHVSERYFPLPRFGGLAAVVRATGSISAAFAAHGVADYTRRDSRITAQLPDAAVAAQLRQPAARPVLLVESVNIDAAALPIEYSRAWFAGDRVSLTVAPGD